MFTHVLEGLIPSGAKPPMMAPSLALNLAILIDNPLQISISEFPKIDSYIMMQYEQIGYGIFTDCLTPNFYEPLIAFIGESVIKAVDGRWEMVKSRHFDVWEPWILSDTEDAIVSYNLTHISRLFQCPEPDLFSIKFNVQYLIEHPKAFVMYLKG